MLGGVVAHAMAGGGPLFDQRQAALAADVAQRREHDRVQHLLVERVQQARVPCRGARMARRVEAVVEREADHLRDGRQSGSSQASKAAHNALRTTPQLPTSPLRIA